MPVAYVCPTYNREAYIERAIMSIDIGDVVFVVDDCSTDETLSMIKNLEEHRQIDLEVLAENSGCPAIPRNIALKKIYDYNELEYVGFLDSDDEFLQGKTNVQLEVLRSNNANLVCSNAIIRSTNSRYFNKKSGWLSVYDLIHSNGIICSSVVCEKRSLKRIGFFNEERDFRAYEDYLLWLKMSLNNKIYYIDEPLIIYQDDSLNSVREDDYFQDIRKKRKVYSEFRNYALEKKKIYALAVLTTI